MQVFSELARLKGFDAGFANELARMARQEMAEVDDQQMEESAGGRIEAGKRRYGVKAELLNYLGYYNPSRVIDQITTNVRRGRLLKQASDKTRFVYDYDADGHPVRIENREQSTVSFGEWYEQCVRFVSFEIREDRRPEIVSATWVQNDESGRVRRWFQVMWHGNMREVDAFQAEVYVDVSDCVQRCVRYEALSNDAGRFEGVCEAEYRIEYDSDGRIVCVETV